MYLRRGLKSLPLLLKRFAHNNVFSPLITFAKCESNDSLSHRIPLSRVFNCSCEPCLPERRRLHSGSNRGVGVITPLFLQAHRFADRVALVDENGVYCYRDLMSCAELLTDRIADHLGGQNDDTSGERVCILCPNNASHVVAQLAVWMSGSIAVALSTKHPAAQLEYFLTDSQCRLVIATEDFADRVQPVVSKLGVALLVLRKTDYSGTVRVRQDESDSNTVDTDMSQQKERHSKRLNRLQQLCSANKFKNKPAAIFYTSGTTGSPKVSI